MKAINMHFAAAQATMKVVDSCQSLDQSMSEYLARMPRHRTLFCEICYGACRYYYYFDAVLMQLLQKPIKANARVVHFILINACYQLVYMRTPDYAVVDQSVEAVKGSHFGWAEKVINGVLRNFLKHRDRLDAGISSAARHAFPEWLYREVDTHWHSHCEKILTASNKKPPLDLRVNRLKTSRHAYLDQLACAGIKAKPSKCCAWGVTLNEPMSVEQIPGFDCGLVSVQDESAQLTESVLPMAAGERVLDGCAAPGGKTGLLIEAQPELAELVAVDRPERIHLPRQNIVRLGIENANITLKAATLTAPETWWDGTPFDQILLDVPCSGSGVIRRHPDIKHRRKPEDIAKFSRQQLELLQAVWPMMINGGALVYITCSILPMENDAVIKEFIRMQPEARPQSLHAPDGITTQYGKQRLPGVHSGDGFYYCRLERVVNSIPH